MSAIAALYDALKRGKSASIAGKYAVWVDWTERQPRYIVSELLSNGRTRHIETFTEYTALVTWLNGLIAAGTINRTPKIVIF